MLSTVGSSTRPWKRPKTTTRKNTLKKLLKRYELEKQRRAKARYVEKPPLNTAGPMSTRA